VIQAAGLPSISVIIPNYNGESVICDCLGSVYGTKYPLLEVVFVDDASNDNSISEVRKYFPKVKILKNRFNSGFARTVNAGIMASSGEILVLLNMDIILGADCLCQLAKVLVEDKEVGIAGPKMLFPDGKTIQHAGGKIRPNGVSVHIGRGELDSGQYDRVAEVDYLCGAVIALRRDLLRDLGCLDEGYRPMYYEDTDLAFRVRGKGYKVVYAHKAVALHKENYSTNGLTRKFYYYYHKNRLRFVARNYGIKYLLTKFAGAEMEWLCDRHPKELFYGLMAAYAINIMTFPLLFMPRIPRDHVSGSGGRR